MHEFSLIQKLTKFAPSNPSLELSVTEPQNPKVD